MNGKRSRIEKILNEENIMAASSPSYEVAAIPKEKKEWNISWFWWIKDVAEVDVMLSRSAPSVKMARWKGDVVYCLMSGMVSDMCWSLRILGGAGIKRRRG